MGREEVARNQVGQNDKIPPPPGGAVLDHDEASSIPAPPAGAILDRAPSGVSGSWAEPAQQIEQTATASQLLKAEFPQFAERHPTATSVLGAAGDVAQGAGREALGQLSRVGAAAFPALRKGTQETKLYSSPIPGTAETIGRIGLNTAEFMAPGGAEKAGAESIGEALVNTPRIVRAAGRLLPEATSSGAINKLQGGSFGIGALAGAGGSALGKAYEEVAPKIMERAIGIGPKQLMYGARPGEEALGVPGFTQAAVKKNAAQKAMDLTSTKLEPMLQEADNAGKTIDLGPARSRLDKAIQNATARNSQPVVERVGNLSSQLSTDMAGNRIPDRVAPTQARALKQGIDDTINSWTSERGGVSRRVTEAAKSARSAIDEQLDAAIPGHAEVNNQIQSLISASKGRGAGRMGLLGRVALPYFGYQVARQEGASPGESIGAALLMEGLASPESRIAIARGLRKFPAAEPFARGGLLGYVNSRKASK